MMNTDARGNLQQIKAKAESLRMPATDAGETSGDFNMRPWPTVLEYICIFS